MATGDFIDLATRGCYRAQRNPNSDYDIARAKELVNECLMALADSGDPWDFHMKEGAWTTVTGSDLYSLSTLATAIGVSEIAEVLGLVDDTSGGRTLPHMSWRELENTAYSTNDDDPAGPPQMWSKWNDRIRIWPAPDQAYTIGAFVRTTQGELTADGDLPEMPTRWATLVVPPYVGAGLLRQDGGSTAAAMGDRLTAEYERNVDKLRDSRAAAQEQNFTAIAPSFTSDLSGADLGLFL